MLGIQYQMEEVKGKLVEVKGHGALLDFKVNGFLALRVSRV